MGLRPRVVVRAGLLALAGLVAALPVAALEFDRLRMLSAEEHKPWRAVGRVNIASFNERGMCTGTLIAPDLVITAAHCVVSKRSGRVYAPGKVHFVAGWRLGNKVGHAKAESITIHPDYRPRERPGLEQIGRDLAIIRLDAPIPGDAAPHFDISPPPRLETALTLISYRQDRAHALTRQKGCEVLGMQGAVIALDCNVTFGASGSPIFAKIDGQQKVIAVISSMSQRDGRDIAWAVRVDAAIGHVLGALD